MSRDWKKDMEDCTQLSKVNLYEWMSTMEPHREKQLIDSLYHMAFHWLQQYAAEKERGDRAIQERKQFNQVYEMLLKKFKESEAREQKLREAIDKAIREYGLWHDEGSAANVMVEILHNAVASLYPKEETKPAVLEEEEAK